MSSAPRSPDPLLVWLVLTASQPLVFLTRLGCLCLQGQVSCHWWRCKEMTVEVGCCRWRAWLGT